MDQITQKKSVVMILKTFFGFKPGQTLQDFNNELKALSHAEKMELAVLAGKELGFEVQETTAAA